VLFAVLVVVSARWAWRRRDHVELALYAVLVLATVLGAFSATRIFGPFFEYVIRWMTPLVALWIATCAWTCWLEWKSREHRRSAAWMWIAGAGACALVASAVGVVRGASADIPFARDSKITGELSAQLERTLDPAATYQINELDPAALGAPAFGLALELERHGLHAGVGPWGQAGVMPFRVVTDENAESTLWYVAGTPLIDAFTTLPGAELKASFDVRSTAEAQRSDQLQGQLEQALCAMGRPDLRSLLFTRWGQTALGVMPDLSPQAADLLNRYNALRLPSAVVELPVGVNGYDAVVAPPPPCTG
jgi:hypothetical protein